MNEEVKEEIEALMSIYEDDMEVLEESPNYVISMNVRSMNEPEDVPSMLLKLTYPEDYPETSPLQIEYDDESEDYEAEDYSELDVVLKEVMEENQGTVVTFLVISAAIEWIEQHHINKKERHERKIREQKEAEEAILTKKLVGTKVTVENFMAWKMEFDAKRLEGKLRKNKDGKEKLTGRELFTQNATLNESDIKFISSEENVDFDEALFEDLDGLEIEEEE